MTPKIAGIGLLCEMSETIRSPPLSINDEKQKMNTYIVSSE